MQATSTFTVLTILLLSHPAAAREQDDPSPDERAERIDRILSTYHAQGQFDGAALVAIDGEVVYRHGFGFADRGTQEAITPDTRFGIASLGKAFTAFLILQLVDEGKLDLEEPIASYLPSYREDIGAKVNTHQLLAHSSGIPWWPDLTKVYYQTPYTLDELVALSNGPELAFEPGTAVLYSNSAYNLAAAILEARTGKKYEDLLRERILEPAGMNDTGCAWPADEVSGRFVPGYDRLPGGRYVPAAYNDQSYAIGGGGLYSSVEDLFRWDRFVVAEEHLSSEATKRIFTNWIEGNGYGWGIGSYVMNGGGGGTMAIGNGGTFGYAAVHSRCIDDDNYVVLLSNISQMNQGRIHNDVFNAMLGFPVDPPEPDATDTFYVRLLDDGIDAVYIDYADKRLQLGWPDETAIHQVGQLYLSRGKLDEALTLLEFNAEVYSTSWTAHDSLGAAYARSNRNDLAARSGVGA